VHNSVKTLGFTLEELEAYALHGLWIAAKKFDKDKSAFRTYAFIRARGHVIDCVRADYPLTRTAVSDGLRMNTFSDKGLDISTDADNNNNLRLLFYGETLKSTLDDKEFITKIFSYLSDSNITLAKDYFIVGLSVKELAVKLKISRSKVWSKIRIIRGELYRIIKNELPKDSVLYRAFKDETFGNENQSNKRYSPAWKRVKAGDCGAFSSVLE
jgi:RNA polymerase sigma factor (sigma-70 family)